MRKSLMLLAAAGALAATAASAQPTPGEQRDMHIGTTMANGSSTIVTDRWGAHPEGYVGFSPINRAMANNTPPPPDTRPLPRHHRRYRDTEPR
jgi:hypothetical protein